MIACDRAVKWWAEEIEAVRTVEWHAREANARHTWNKTTTGWEGYAVDTSEYMQMVEKKGIRKDR